MRTAFSGILKHLRGLSRIHSLKQLFHRPLIRIKVGKHQDGGVGRHTAPPRTTRIDRKSNHREVRHQVDKKETYIQTGRRGGDGQLEWRGLAWPWRDPDWRQKGQALWPLAEPRAPHSRTDKRTGPDSEWQRTGQAEQRVAPRSPTLWQR